MYHEWITYDELSIYIQSPEDLQSNNSNSNQIESIQNRNEPEQQIQNIDINQDQVSSTQPIQHSPPKVYINTEEEFDKCVELLVKIYDSSLKNLDNFLSAKQTSIVETSILH